MPIRGVGPERAERKRHAQRQRSIAEKAFADINGVRQGMFIQGADSRLPVLLYLHGGMPEYFLAERYPTGLEEKFTVVWWEQRGAGLSYSPGIPPETKTCEQFIADTLALTGYLRDRFGKEKIYLMAHSGGTFFGLQAGREGTGTVQRIHRRRPVRRAARVRKARVRIHA
jgi:pimeloyl-ACP methyl ester carboxylesterase